MSEQAPVEPVEYRYTCDRCGSESIPLQLSLINAFILGHLCGEGDAPSGRLMRGVNGSITAVSIKY